MNQTKNLGDFTYDGNNVWNLRKCRKFLLDICFWHAPDDYTSEDLVKLRDAADVLKKRMLYINPQLKVW